MMTRLLCLSLVVQWWPDVCRSDWRAAPADCPSFRLHSVHSPAGHLKPNCPMKQRSGSISGGGALHEALAILH